MVKTTKAKGKRAPAKGKAYGKAPGRAGGRSQGKPAGKSWGKPGPGKTGKDGKPFRRVYGKASTASGRPQATTHEPGADASRRGGRDGGKVVPRRKPRAPRAAAAPVARTTPVPAQPAADGARPTAVAIAKAALDKKGEDVVVLDVRGLTSYADYFVVVTADSDRQASAIADHVEQTMKEQGVSKVGVEGYESGRWILVDYGDVVAHVMNRESRGFYDLEGLWADAPRFAVEA